ncbi:hypothetical protein BOTBODRAFT_39278 [Botryobasidium botryosum FD-172 SS1]|uniref:Actin interacting protein 3 C-terminal domain-containing protein n=1 Tax=Botryobasidium botryosum (strain FD-172 SS1) TaxID=930990 RepID=A0A067LX17_BOTB1|nr:hypothetical protein BOTBODRAFT_39278 [Botryobasidium botryosum FD-172 SS1]
MESVRSNRREASVRSNAEPAHAPAVETSVTRLLVAIKTLLEVLNLWSTGQKTEDEVSDVYVELGNNFNTAVGAFQACSIDMTELLSVPDDLRAILEQALAEDASPANLELYLPSVRQIITNLLQGIRAKQSVYRRNTAPDRQERRSRSDHNSVYSTTSSRHDRTSSHSSRTSSRAERRLPAGGEPHGEPARMPPTRRNEYIPQPPPTHPPPPPPIGEPSRWVGGFSAPSDPREHSLELAQLVAHAHAAEEHLTAQSQSNNAPPDWTPDIPSKSALPAHVTGPSENGGLQRGFSRTSRPKQSFAEEDGATPPVSVQPQAVPLPPEVRRYSLVDRPASATPPPMDPNPQLVVDAGTPMTTPNRAEAAQERALLAPGSPSPPPTPPDGDRALAMLKRSEVERRASKRFSSYTFSKMAGGVNGREKSHRRAMPSQADLHALPELDEEDRPKRSKSMKGKDRELRERQSNESIGTRKFKPPTILEEPSSPPPPVPKPPSILSNSDSVKEASTAPPQIDSEAITGPSGGKPMLTLPTEAPTRASSAEPTTPVSQLITVFLQVGRQVKKVSVEPTISFAGLRVLFVDKFSYSPGQDNFPEIYIRDSSSGVQYELEDIEEVRDNSLLTLNIEPLDQIRHHFDNQMSTITQELKDLRTSVEAARRAPPPVPTTMMSPPDTSAVHTRPSDKQFQTMARRLSHLKTSESTPTISPLTQQSTGGSVVTISSDRIVSDLKSQFDEVQNLRRDLGVMKQLYMGFIAQTKESIGALRTQTQSVRSAASTQVGGGRAYMESGKTKLDSRSQSVLTKIEELTDTVEMLKDDVLKRHVSPKIGIMRNLKRDVEAAAKELESLQHHITTIRPMWKKTWEEELQNIVEEQQFLSHQEELLADLLEDHKAVLEVFGHVEKVISIRGGGARTGGVVGSGRTFRPPPLEEGHNGMSTVLLEIKGAASDPERRMKAIEASQKQRQKELESRSDEFQEELSGFVAGKKLKMTGGAEEAERLRQKKNEATLKAMFSTGEPLLSPEGSSMSLPPDHTGASTASDSTLG